MGELRLLLINEENGEWEAEWEPLRGTVFGDQFTVATKETINHALNRYSRPLVHRLGPTPEGALKKIPPVSRECFRRKICPLYVPNLCFPESKNMPWCFEPDGVADPNVRYAATRAIEQWRDRVYLVVVQP
jgi:hypothetical protein